MTRNSIAANTAIHRDTTRNLIDDVAEVQADVAEVQADVVGVKSDVVGVKSDVAVIQADVAEVKDEIAVIQTDVAEDKNNHVSILNSVSYPQTVAFLIAKELEYSLTLAQRKNTIVIADSNNITLGNTETEILTTDTILKDYESFQKYSLPLSQLIIDLQNYLKSDGGKYKTNSELASFVMGNSVIEFNIRTNTIDYFYINNTLAYSNKQVKSGSTWTFDVTYNSPYGELYPITVYNNVPSLLLQQASSAVGTKPSALLLNGVRYAETLISLSGDTTTSIFPDLPTHSVIIGGNGVEVTSDGTPPTENGGVTNPYYATTKGLCIGPGIGSVLGAQILNLGGNAADALVTASFDTALSSAQGQGFIGGAGFIVVYDPTTGLSRSIDCREALSNTFNQGNNTTYLDYTITGNGAKFWPGGREEFVGSFNPSPPPGWDSIRRYRDAVSCGVPGFTAGLYKMWELYGSKNFTFQELLQPVLLRLKLNFKEPVALNATVGTTGMVSAENTSGNLEFLDKSGHNRQYSSSGNPTGSASDPPSAISSLTAFPNLRTDKKIKLLESIIKYGIDFIYKSQTTLSIDEPTFADSAVSVLRNSVANSYHEFTPSEQQTILDNIITIPDFENYEAKLRDSVKVSITHNSDIYDFHCHPAPCSSVLVPFIVKLALDSQAVEMANGSGNFNSLKTILRMAMILQIASDLRNAVTGDYDTWNEYGQSGADIPKLKAADPSAAPGTYSLSQQLGELLSTYSITGFPGITNLPVTGPSLYHNFANWLLDSAIIVQFTAYLNTLDQWNNVSSLPTTSPISPPALKDPVQKPATNNVSCVDSNGLAISFNNSLNEIGGCQLAVDDILLNNEAYDHPDISSLANIPIPGRRPASSQSPVVVVKDGKPIFTGGGAGIYLIYQDVAYRILGMMLNNNVTMAMSNVVCYGAFGGLVFTNLVNEDVQSTLNGYIASNTGNLGYSYVEKSPLTYLIESTFGTTENLFESSTQVGASIFPRSALIKYAGAGYLDQQ